MNLSADGAPCARPLFDVAHEQPCITIKAYRVKGGAVVNVVRGSCEPRRYRVSLKRYAALREWTAFGRHHWRASGAWLRTSMTVYFWEGKR